MSTSSRPRRIAANPRVPLGPGHPARTPSPASRDPVATASNATSGVLAAARRIGESVLIAAFASTGLYLVGTVYTDAYYGRLSIEVTSLDLSPTYIALQSVHALAGLLQYPSLLLVSALLFRLVFTSRRPRAWLERAWHRAPRLLALLANLAIVAPLLVVALWLLLSLPDPATGSVLAEAWDLLVGAGLILLLYAVWLGWGQGVLILARVRARAFVPVALLLIVYVLTALVQTAVTATVAAEQLLTGVSDNAMRVVFTPKTDQTLSLPDRALILVTKRSNAFYVVEQQSFPPSRRPAAYVIPVASVESAELRRVNEAWSPLGAGSTAAPR